VLLHLCDSDFDQLLTQHFHLKKQTMLGKGTACNEGCNAAKGKPQMSMAVCGQTNLKMAKIYPLFYRTT
jgi:hypothetical protein